MRRILLALCILAVPIATAACTPDEVALFVANYHPAPSGHNCYGTDAQPYIDRAWSGTGQEAEASHIAWGESKCTTGVNMMQLQGKWGFLEQACPGYPGGAYESLHDPFCNAYAGRIMWEAHGRNFRVDWPATA